MTQFFLNESFSEVRQAGGDKKGGEFQNVGDSGRIFLRRFRLYVLSFMFLDSCL